MSEELFIHTATKQLVSLAGLRQILPDIVIPEGPDAEMRETLTGMLAEHGYAPVTVAERPATDWDEETLPAAPRAAGGKWRMAWTRRPLPAADRSALLATLKEEACVRVDETAGQIRSRFGSRGYGQEMTYLAKEAEAREYLRACAADQTPQPADYPLIAGEVGVTAATLKAVAEAIIAKATAWRQLGARVENARLAAKQRIRAAASPAGIEAAEAATVWPPEETPEETPGVTSSTEASPTEPVEEEEGND